MKMADGFARLKAWVEQNPRAAFLISLGVLVGLTIFVAALLPSGPPPGGAGGSAGVSATHTHSQTPKTGKTGDIITPVVNGPLNVVAFHEGEVSDITLGGVLPTGEGVIIKPKRDCDDDWGSGWAKDTREEAERCLKPATVTWPLGGRYSRLTARAGFLPFSDTPGGRYEIYLDGRKVWEKAVSPDDVAMGRASDAPLTLDLTGVKTLTLRVKATVWGRQSFGEWDYYPTIPYPVVLYDVRLEKAGGK